MRLRLSVVRQGFTLIEMLAVTAILAVLAAIIVGRLQNVRDGIQFRRAVQNIESAANKAKSQAIQTGQTTELTFDNSTQSLKVAAVEATTSTTSAKIPSTKTKTTTNPTTQDGQSTDAALGAGWTVSEVRNSDGTTDTQMSIKFYADGTAETKSVEFHSGQTPVSLIVRQNGTIEVKRGALADEKNQEWEAGNIEQRSSG